MKNTEIKLKLLKQISRCDVYENGCGDRNITSLQTTYIIDKMLDGIKVSKQDIEKVNTMWKELKRVFENCMDADDISRYVIVTMPSFMDIKMFWKAFTTLKEIYSEEVIIRRDVKPFARKQKHSIKPIYGRHFNQYNQGQ